MMQKIQRETHFHSYSRHYHFWIFASLTFTGFLNQHVQSVPLLQSISISSSSSSEESSLLSSSVELDLDPVRDRESYSSLSFATHKDSVFPVSAAGHTKSNEEDDEKLREPLLCLEGNHLSRYDPQAQKCGEIGSSAHCGTNMIFKDQPDSFSYGYCECDFENFDVPLVYHPRTNACYETYSQGYCDPDEWLILSKAGNGPSCEKNKCLQEKRTLSSSGKILFPDSNLRTTAGQDPARTDNNEIRKARNFSSSIVLHQQSSVWVPLNGTGPCVLLKEASKFCKSGRERVIIPLGQYVPRCEIPDKSLRRLYIVPNPCPPGSAYSIIGYCQPIWDF